MQLVIISGKGGTGKTTIASSLAHLGNTDIIKVDCDVDASNLHLMFDREDIKKDDFYGAKVAEIHQSKCINCGKCSEVCRFGAIYISNEQTMINGLKCEGCGACRLVCDKKAIHLEYEVTGKTYTTQTPRGLISRAEMFPGAEGSGKLVTHVRSNAKKMASNDPSNYIIDGSPGIGCVVMASVTGCDYCLMVTEPSQSAYEDFLRIHELIKHFEIEGFVVINKYDINLDISKKIEKYCSDEDMKVIGKVPFDNSVILSINEGKPIVTYEHSIAGKAIVKMWNTLKTRIGV